MNLTNAKCVALVSADAPIVKVENGEPWWLDPDDGWWRLMFTTKLGNYGPLRDSLRAALERYQRDQHEGFCADYANDPSVDPPKVPIVPDGIYAAVERECPRLDDNGQPCFGLIWHADPTDKQEGGHWRDDCLVCHGTNRVLELVPCEDVTVLMRTWMMHISNVNSPLIWDMLPAAMREAAAYLIYTDTEAKVARRDEKRTI